MKRNGYIIFTYIGIAWIMMESKGGEDHDAKTYSKVCVSEYWRWVSGHLVNDSNKEERKVL